VSGHDAGFSTWDFVDAEFRTFVDTPREKRHRA